MTETAEKQPEPATDDEASRRLVESQKAEAPALPSFKRAAEEARSREPKEDAVKGQLARKLRLLQGTLVLWLFQLNDYIINRFGPNHPALYSADEFPWGREVESQWEVVKDEMLAFLDHKAMPTTAENAGLDPSTEEGRRATNVDRGTWRTSLLNAHGKWVGAYEHFPRTVEICNKVPQFATMGFSALEPHSHIATHYGPNKGGLRYQLPIIVPGEPGDCRIRIEDDMCVWREGEALIFDLACSHEAWNDSDGFRVLMMLEVMMPLPFPLSLINRFTQYCYRFHPSYRQMADRATDLANQYNRDKK